MKGGWIEKERRVKQEAARRGRERIVEITFRERLMIQRLREREKGEGKR